MGIKTTTPYKIITTVGDFCGIYSLTTVNGQMREIGESEIHHAEQLASNYSRREACIEPDEWHQSDIWLFERGLCVVKVGED